LKQLQDKQSNELENQQRVVDEAIAALEALKLTHHNDLLDAQCRVDLAVAIEQSLQDCKPVKKERLKEEKVVVPDEVNYVWSNNNCYVASSAQLLSVFGSFHEVLFGQAETNITPFLNTLRRLLVSRANKNEIASNMALKHVQQQLAAVAGGSHWSEGDTEDPTEYLKDLLELANRQFHVLGHRDVLKQLLGCQ
jgi:hypothetical protein